MIEVRYRFGPTLKAVSGWLNTPPYTFNMALSIPGFDTFVPEDGIFHLTVEVRTTGASKLTLSEMAPSPIFVHVRRGGTFPTSLRSPAGLYEPDPNDQTIIAGSRTNQGIIRYVDFNERNVRGYPLDPSITQKLVGLPEDNWSTMVSELMTVWSPLFLPIDFWWIDPVNVDLYFVVVVSFKKNYIFKIHFCAYLFDIYKKTHHIQGASNILAVHSRAAAEARRILRQHAHVARRSRAPADV